MKTRFLAFVCVWLSALLLIASNQARARDGPLIPSQHNLPFVPASPKPEPPPAIPLPEELPKISKPKPTPTMSEGTRVTAELKVKRCGLYEKIVVRWLEMEKAEKDEFHNLTLDDVPLIMAVMAAESGCDPDVKSSAGAIGLMQVIPRSWLPDVRSDGMNVYAGMYILDRSINLAAGDVRLALAFYNCGVPKVEANACGTKGGLAYADKVLNFWKPLFVKE